MLRKRGRLGVALALAMLLAGAPAAAAPAGQESPGWLAQAWQWAQTLWGKRSAHIDPDGAPLNNSERGLHIDPNGAALTGSDVSLHIDPNG